MSETRMKRERLKLGFSQAEIARRVGCNASSISRIERGEEPAYPRRGAKIAAVLGWTGSLDDLFSDREG